MTIEYQEFSRNAENLKSAVAELCLRYNRPVDSVKVMAVTKAHGPEAVEFARRFGLPMVGENRVQEAAEKKARVETDIKWELIGHLQTNKARTAIRVFDRIQSVDRIKLVTFLDRICRESDLTLPILLEVNAGHDPAKFGVTCGEAPGLLESALRARHLSVEGLMTIAPWDSNPDVSKRTFTRLRELRDELQEQFGIPLSELSMGMTQDLAAAIEAGSTLVRVGTALYGQREVRQWRP